MQTYYPEVNVKLDDGAFMPERTHETDAGADIRTPYEVTIPSMGFVFIDTGVHIELSPNLCARVESKSGLWRYHHIFTTGLVDRGYDGAIGVTLANFGSKPYTFKRGEKIAQLTISHVCTPTFLLAEEIQGGERGSAGFGSSGRL